MPCSQKKFPGSFHVWVTVHGRRVELWTSEPRDHQDEERLARSISAEARRRVLEMKGQGRRPDVVTIRGAASVKKELVHPPVAAVHGGLVLGDTNHLIREPSRQIVSASNASPVLYERNFESRHIPSEPRLDREQKKNASFPPTPIASHSLTTSEIPSRDHLTANGKKLHNDQSKMPSAPPLRQPLKDVETQPRQPPPNLSAPAPVKQYSTPVLQGAKTLSALHVDDLPKAQDVKPFISARSTPDSYAFPFSVLRENKEHEQRVMEENEKLKKEVASLKRKRTPEPGDERIQAENKELRSRMAELNKELDSARASLEKETTRAKELERKSKTTELQPVAGRESQSISSPSAQANTGNQSSPVHASLTGGQQVGRESGTRVDDPKSAAYIMGSGLTVREPSSPEHVNSEAQTEESNIEISITANTKHAEEVFVPSTNKSDTIMDELPEGDQNSQSPENEAAFSERLAQMKEVNNLVRDR